MRAIRLIHWHAEEAKERTMRLRLAGYEVDGSTLDKTGLEKLKNRPPDAIVIDLSRLPAQGRDMGLVLRKHKATRHVPIVFVGGIQQKVERVMRALPDAVFTDWDSIGAAIEKAIASPPVDPVVPQSTLNGYAGTPLPDKLGIGPDTKLVIIGAPDGFDKRLGKVMRHARLKKRLSGPVDLVLWFVKSRKALEGRIEKMRDSIGDGHLWIIWPKKTSVARSDLSQKVVRETGLAIGLVDFKVCSVDETWSGLKFTRRKST